MSWPWNRAGTYLRLRWWGSYRPLTNHCWQRIGQVSAKYVRHAGAIFPVVLRSKRVELSEAEPTAALAPWPWRDTVSESQIVWIWTTLKAGIRAFGLPGAPQEPLSPTLHKDKTFPCLNTWREKTALHRTEAQKQHEQQNQCFLHRAAHAKPDRALHLVANMGCSRKSYWGFVENTLLWKQFCLYIIHFPVIFIPLVFYYWGIFAWK